MENLRIFLQPLKVVSTTHPHPLFLKSINKINMKNDNNVSRRKFMATTGTALAGAMMLNPLNAVSASDWSADKKKRIAIVGTGSRALGMWSKDVQKNYADKVEYVGLCDINPGRVEYFKKAAG